MAIAVLLLASLLYATPGALELQPSFGDPEDQAAADLIATQSPTSADDYRSLDPAGKAAFLATYWGKHCPQLLKYYYGYHLGQRRYSISASYFDRFKKLPKPFQSGRKPLASEKVACALDHTRFLLSRLPDDPIAHCATGYLHLELGDFDSAADAFQRALGEDRHMAEARFGLGLSLLMQPGKVSKATKVMQEALAEDRDYVDIYYALSVANIVMETFDVGIWLERLVERAPDHPDGHFKLGVYYEGGRLFDKEPDLAAAEAAYRSQLEGAPDHVKARLQLASIFEKTDRPEEAVEIWESFLATPDLRRTYIGQVLAAYVAIGLHEQADSVFTLFLSELDEPEKDIYLDLSPIATQAEMSAFDSLEWYERASHIEAFWRRRDPTPATPVNERRTEHYRRVNYALTHFKQGSRWDRRGDVYIRYGEPAHISRNDDIRFEYNPDVVKVKERLIASLPQTARQEIVERQSRLRTSSVRGIALEPGVGGNGDPSIVNFDFESVDFEYNMSTRGPADMAQTGFTTRAEMAIDTIRGYPLFPVAGTSGWEYWIYPNIADGVEIVFTAATTFGTYDFPQPFGDRDISRTNAVTWAERLPEDVFAKAVKHQPDTYPYPAPVLDFKTTSADFRSEGPHTRLELYFGIPVGDLSATEPDTGRLSRGVAVFTPEWKPLHQRVDTMRYLAARGTDQVAVSETSLELPPGRYVIGTQFRDVGGKAFGGQYQTVTVEPYEHGLNISDIELASQIHEDFRRSRKDGLMVIPNPTTTYRRDQPVLIYYEVYGLEKDEFGQTSYEVTYEVSPADHTGRFVTRVLRSIGKVLKTEQSEVLTITVEQAGYRSDQNEYIELDVENTPPGRYDLTATLTDRVQSISVTKETTFTIAEPGR